MKATIVPRSLTFLALAVAAILVRAEERPDAIVDRVAEPVLASIEAHEKLHPGGAVAFSWDQEAYRKLDTGEMADLPIGVFDSGIGGLTVLEALLTADYFNNDTLKPGADGRADFAGERFLYLGDQANMPYGNYPAQGREDYLRELVLKDAVFQLGRRYHVRGEGGALSVRMDKPPVKAIVIACNTASAYGLESVRDAIRRWDLPVLVVGVIEAGARGLKETPGDGAVGVLATVGTCASKVYPKTIARTLGLAGRTQPVVTQWGSVRLAGVIEGDPAFATPLREQVAADVRALVEAHRDKVHATSVAPEPLQRIVLGCTHFPLVTAELDAAFETLRAQPDLAPWIASKREYVNPAEWTARELFKELARARLHRVGKATATKGKAAAPQAGFFISVAHDACPGVKLAAPGVLDADYKFQRRAGRMEVEDTVVVPMTRTLLPEASRSLLRERLPTVWKLLPES